MLKSYITQKKENPIFFDCRDRRTPPGHELIASIVTHFANVISNVVALSGGIGGKGVGLGKGRAISPPHPPPGGDFKGKISKAV